MHNPDLRNFIVDVRKKYDQIIDTVNIDEITNIGWATDQKEQAESTVKAFERWVQEHKDEALALQIFYDAPYRRRELTYQLIRDLYEKLILEQPTLQPAKLWDAYSQIENNPIVTGKQIGRAHV